MFSVTEATDRLYQILTEYTGWKFLKSQKCLKKVVGDLVFQINFFTSKWNLSYEHVEVQCECQMWCKKFDKTFNVVSAIGYYSLNPLDERWYDISDETKLAIAVKQICTKLDEAILPLCKIFEEDFLQGVLLLAEEDNFNKYHVRLEFIDVYAGRQYIRNLARSYVAPLSDYIKQDMVCYKQGDRSKWWMRCPSNLKYIVDNNLLDED